MTAEEFISDVQAALGIGDLQSALEAGRATLQALAECLPEDVATAVSRHLPPEFGHFLQRPEGVAPSCAPAELVARISEREGIEPGPAAAHLRAVMGVLRRALPDEARAILDAALPADREEARGD